jgi:hypothetical protein
MMGRRLAHPDTGIHDHGHLGQILTYLAGIDGAKTVVCGLPNQSSRTTAQPLIVSRPARTKNWKQQRTTIV